MPNERKIVVPPVRPAKPPTVPAGPRREERGVYVPSGPAVDPMKETAPPQGTGIQRPKPKD